MAFIDTDWLVREAAELAGQGTPRQPLLVGGAGLIGSNMLVLIAHTPGVEKVRVLDMKPPDGKVLARAGIPSDKVEFISHRLGYDPYENLLEATRGVDCVFSMVTPPIRDGTTEDFFCVNVDGQHQLLKASQANGVGRYILLSSIAVANHLFEKKDFKEDMPLPPLETYRSSYDVSKRLGEEAVLAANSEGLRTCSLRPGGVCLSPSDYIFREILRVSGIVWAPTGEVQDFIDGRDVCRAMLLAAQKLEDSTNTADVAGQAFWIMGEAMHASKLAWLCGKYLGWVAIKVPVPVVYLACVVGWIVYHLRRVLGLRVSGFPSYLFMQVMMYEQTFNSSKARRCLGFQPKVSIEESVQRICKVYMEDKDLRRSLTIPLGSFLATTGAAAVAVLALLPWLV